MGENIANVTNGSDTGNRGSWSSIVGEAINGFNGNSGGDWSLSLSDIMKMSSVAAVESLIGLGRNPFLGTAPQGKLMSPDGSSFDINISETCYRWVNVKCMPNSPAESWGVTRTSSKNEHEFLREIISCGSQMRAQGLGLVLLLVSVISGTLHDRLRDILMRFLSCDEDWLALTGWSKWVSVDPASLTESKRKQAVLEAKAWNDVWFKLSKELVTGLQSAESETTIDVSNTISRYGSLMKRKKISDVDTTLLEESEWFTLLKSHGIVIPWVQRSATRTHILERYYGPLIVSFLPSLTASEDITSWENASQVVRKALDKFMESDPPQKHAAGPENSKSRNGHRPNRLEQRREREAKFERKLKIADVVVTPDVKAEVQPTKTCYNCGGSHLIRDCPKPRRQSARIAEQYKQKSLQTGRVGLLGHQDSDEVDSDDEQCDRVQDDVEYVTPDNSDDEHSNKEDSEVDANSQDGGLGLFANTKTNSRIRTVIIDCNGKKLKFGLDGGLDVSLITRKHVQRGSITKPTNIKLHGLAGSVRINELLLCKFDFGTKELGVIETLPANFDGLLGIDLIDQVDIPSVIQFRKAYKALQEELTDGNRNLEPMENEDGTWTPMFVATTGPLLEDELRLAVSDLRLPFLDCKFDSPYPVIRDKPRPVPPAWREKADEMIDKLVKKGIMTPCDNNPFGWISPGMFIPKKSSSGEIKLRFVIDYTRVNERVKQDCALLYPHTQGSLIAKVPRSAQYFATTDIADAFFQLPVRKDIKEFLRTSITTSKGERIFTMNRGPQGFTLCPIFWIGFIDELLRSLNNVFTAKFPTDDAGAIAFMDDILCYGKTETSTQRIQDSLHQLLTCLGIPYGKTVRASPEVKMIGLVFSSTGIRFEACDYLSNTKTPTDKSELRTALGVFQYVRKSYECKQFLQHIATLSRLLKKSVRFKWNAETQRSWDWLTSTFDELYYSFFSERDRLEENEYFVIQCDASDKGLATVLFVSDCKPPLSGISPTWFSQHCKLINSKSRVYNAQEISYPTWDLEALAIYESLKEFGDMLLVACDRVDKVWIFSDSKAAVDRWNKVLRKEPIDKNCQGLPRARRWARWIDDLQILFLLNIRLCHINGSDNLVADYFSRAFKNIAEKPMLGLLGGTISTLEDQEAGIEISPTTNEAFVLTDLHDRIRSLLLDSAFDDEYKGKSIREIIEKQDTSSNFRMMNGLLYFCAAESGPRLYIPKGKIQLDGNMVDLRVTIVALAHQGHVGIARTTTNLMHYFWPRMGQMISAYVRSCEFCQRKNVKQNYGKLTGRNLASRFERIIVDHASPPGHGHILVVIDSFTRYIQLYEVKSTAAVDTAERLLEWCLTFGFPREIVTDNATGLRHMLIDKVLSLNSEQSEGVKRWTCPAFYPQAQGEAERIVGEVKTYINTRGNRNWGKFLPWLSYAHNTAEYGASGIAPYMLVYGTSPTRLTDLFNYPVGDNNTAGVEDFVDEIKTALEEFHNLHRLKIAEYRAGSRQYYNDKHGDYQFEIGERAWIVIKTPFRAEVSGPAEVIRRVGDHFYEVKIDDDVRTVPLQQMAPYVQEPSIDRSGIPFASSEHFDDGMSALLLKDPRLLEEDDLALVQRGVASDIYEYDIARIISNNPQGKIVRCELMVTGEQSGQRDRWRATGLEFNFRYESILATGFKLTKNKQLRKSTVKLWNQLGIAI